MVQRYIAFGVVGLLLGLLVAITSMAKAQSPLERLETQIRERSQPGSPKPPPPAGIQPETASPTAPTEITEKKEVGYLGIKADDRQDRGRGVRILSVNPGSPAEKGGLKKQDLIVSVSGVRVRQMSEMADVLDLFAVGETVAFQVARENQTVDVKVTLGRRPASSKPTFETIPLPPGESTSLTPPTDTKTPPPASQPRSETARTGEMGIAEPEPSDSPVYPPRTAGTGSRPSVEELQRRIDQLERRIEFLEKSLSELRKSSSVSRPHERE